jgi:aminocarboxymuconate-semialdehyde decarboxylase
MRIDVHCHIVPEDCLHMTYTAPDGRVYGTDARQRPDGAWEVTLDGHTRPGKDGAIDRPFEDSVVALFDIDLRLHHMDQMGIDMQAIAVPPFMYFYAADASTALDYAQKLNNSISKEVERHEDRLIGLATVPLQDPAAAAKELERAVHSLGMKGVEIGSNVDGKNLDLPEFRPFFAKAEELNVPIFIHPHYVLGLDRLSRYHLGNLIGNPTDSSVAAASLIFGGVMEDFPRLNIYLAHAGGSMPYICGRWEHGWRNNTIAHSALIKPPSTYFGRFRFDTIAHSRASLAFLITTFGADKVLLGTDYPFDMGDYRPVEHVQELTEIPESERRQIIEENAPRLFRRG